MNQERLLKVILAPHISEKASVGLEKHNEHQFYVANDATKPEVKDAIEHLFEAKVKAVRIMRVPAKKKMFKGMEGKRKSWKKAFVTLLPGEKIDMGQLIK